MEDENKIEDTELNTESVEKVDLTKESNTESLDTLAQGLDLVPDEAAVATLPVNLYVVGHGVYQYHTIAESEDDAISKVCNQYSLHYLPFKATMIDLEGYKLVKE